MHAQGPEAALSERSPLMTTSPTLMLGSAPSKFYTSGIGVVLDKERTSNYSITSTVRAEGEQREHDEAHKNLNLAGKSFG